MHTVFSLYFFCVVGGGDQTATSTPVRELPTVLQKALLRRTAIDTVWAKYTYNRHWRENVSPTIQHREDRIAGRDVYSINRGDYDEVIYGPRGVETPNFGVGLTFATHSVLSLRSTGEEWSYYHDDLNVSIRDFNYQESQLGDLRSVGLGQVLPRLSPEQILQRWLLMARKYEWTEQVLPGALNTMHVLAMVCFTQHR